MPPYVGFCGPSSASQSVQADCEDLYNWFVERVEMVYAPTGAALYPTPGFAQLAVAPQLGTRALWWMGGRAFAVIGTGFYEISNIWGLTLRGAVATDQYPATISYNGAAGGQLWITSGGNGYLFTLATNVLTPLLAGEANVGGMLNGRFLAFNLTNGRVRMSNLNDGTVWDPLMYFQRGLAADPWQMMVVNPPNIWMLGAQSSEVWYDSGAYPMPMAPVPGAFFMEGTVAPFAAGVSGQTVFWVTRTARGAGQIVAARGYNPQPISNYSVETALAAFQRTVGITDAEVMAYSDAGHEFGVFTFGKARTTFVYDFSMGMWHKRGAWDSVAGKYDTWGPYVYAYIYGKHVIGVRSTGQLLEMDTTFGSEANGLAIRRMRIGPPLYAPSSGRISISRLEVLAESGLGLPIGQGSDPQMMLRTSENAKTWSAERMASAGKIGNYNRRIFWTRCGSSRKLWVPEVTVTDPIPWRLSGATIEGYGIQQVSSTG